MMLKENDEQNDDNDQKQNGQNNYGDVGHKFDASIHRVRAVSGSPTFGGHDSGEAGKVWARGMNGIWGTIIAIGYSTPLKRIKVILKIRIIFCRDLECTVRWSICPLAILRDC